MAIACPLTNDTTLWAFITQTSEQCHGLMPTNAATDTRRLRLPAATIVLASDSQLARRGMSVDGYYDLWQPPTTLIIANGQYCLYLYL